MKDPKVSLSCWEIPGGKKNGEKKLTTNLGSCTKPQDTEGCTLKTGPENSNVTRSIQWDWCDDSDMDKYHSMAQNGYNEYWTDLNNKTSKCVTREEIKYVFINLIQIKLVVHKLMSHVFLIKCN